MSLTESIFIDHCIDESIELKRRPGFSILPKVGSGGFNGCLSLFLDDPYTTVCPSTTVRDMFIDIVRLYDLFHYNQPIDDLKIYNHDALYSDEGLHHRNRSVYDRDYIDLFHNLPVEEYINLNGDTLFHSLRQENSFAIHIGKLKRDYNPLKDVIRLYVLFGYNIVDLDHAIFNERYFELECELYVENIGCSNRVYTKIYTFNEYSFNEFMSFDIDDRFASTEVRGKLVAANLEKFYDFNS